MIIFERENGHFFDDKHMYHHISQLVFVHRTKGVSGSSSDSEGELICISRLGDGVEDNSKRKSERRRKELDWEDEIDGGGISSWSLLDDVEHEEADDGMDERIVEGCSDADEEDEVGLAIRTCRCDLWRNQLLNVA